MVKSVLQKTATPYVATNFIYPKWVKLDTLLKTSEKKQRENSLATARVQKGKPNKIKSKENIVSTNIQKGDY